MKTGKKILEEYRKGKKPVDLIEEKFASKNTIYKYWKIYETYIELREKLWTIIYDSA